MTDSTTAELLKLSINAFFTTKIVFANEIFDYAQKVKANYETIKVALENHPWGSKGHFTIHHKGGRGAGGKCLAKDMDALIEVTGSTLFAAVGGINAALLLKSGKK